MAKPGQHAHSRHRQQQQPHRREREKIGLDGAAAAGAARPAEEGDAVGRTKQAADKAAASASMAPTAGTSELQPPRGSSGLSRIAWKSSHSETKPLSGGRAEMATQPPRTDERGQRHAMDQAAELLDVALAASRVSTAPAPKNSRLLNRE